MIIGIDLDSVIRDIISTTLVWWEAETGIKKYKEDITKWDIYDSLDGPKSDVCLDDFYDLWFNAKSIWRYAPPVIGAIEALEKLQPHNILIITDQKTHKQQIWTLEWIDENLKDLYDALVITGQKNLIQCDVLIDDGPQNFDGFYGKAILFSQPWNWRDIVHTRISGWDDPILESLSKWD